MLKYFAIILIISISIDRSSGLTTTQFATCISDKCSSDLINCNKNSDCNALVITYTNCVSTSETC
jgi:hypothetical protein